MNNTGINPAYGPLTELDEGVARKIMDVNVLAALAWSRRRTEHGLGRVAAGAIVNIASVAGLQPAPGIAYYGVSKSALIRLTVQLAAELAPPGAGQRGRAGRGEDAVRRGAVRGGRGQGGSGRTRSGGSVSRRTSVPRWRSSPPATGPGSPVRPSSSTAAPASRASL